eukprot:404934-Amphidinium_carterae.1
MVAELAFTMREAAEREIEENNEIEEENKENENKKYIDENKDNDEYDKKGRDADIERLQDGERNNRYDGEDEHQVAIPTTI